MELGQHDERVAVVLALCIVVAMALAAVVGTVLGLLL